MTTPVPDAPRTLDGWLGDQLQRLYDLSAALHDFYFTHQARLIPTGEAL